MSILNIGLILTHERIKFPFVRKDKIDFEMGSIVDQLRCCFTFLDSRELPEHSAMFGAFSLEFDVESLRELGAFPVIYIPQPIRDGKAGFREVSIVGNQLVHQLRDVAVLLEELLQLQATVDDNPDLGESEIQVRTTRKLGATKLSSVELIVDHLLGEKVSFLNLLGSVHFITNLFYHVDSTRPEMSSIANDLRYYLQREWRIVSGLMNENVAVDSPLSRDQICSLEKMNVFFSKPVSLRDGSTERHSHVIRSIANYRDLPLWGIVRCFHVPDVIADEARIEFEKRGIPPSLITEVDYSEIQRIRDPVRYSQ